MISSIIIEGLIYGIMVLGVFSTFRILNFCDMTVKSGGGDFHFILRRTHCRSCNKRDLHKTQDSRFARRNSYNDNALFRES